MAVPVQHCPNFKDHGTHLWRYKAVDERVSAGWVRCPGIVTAPERQCIVTKPHPAHAHMLNRERFHCPGTATAPALAGVDDGEGGTVYTVSETLRMLQASCPLCAPEGKGCTSECREWAEDCRKSALPATKPCRNPKHRGREAEFGCVAAEAEPACREGAHAAVYAYIGSLGDSMPYDPAERNAMIWRGVHAALEGGPNAEKR
jgi:hypothetical protein